METERFVKCLVQREGAHSCGTEKISDKRQEKVPIGRKPAWANGCTRDRGMGDEKDHARDALPCQHHLFNHVEVILQVLLKVNIWSQSLVSQSLCLGLFHVWGLFFFPSRSKLHHLSSSALNPVGTLASVGKKKPTEETMNIYVILGLRYWKGQLAREGSFAWVRFCFHLH